MSFGALRARALQVRLPGVQFVLVPPFELLNPFAQLGVQVVQCSHTVLVFLVTRHPHSPHGGRGEHTGFGHATESQDTCVICESRLSDNCCSCADRASIDVVVDRWLAPHSDCSDSSVRASS